MIGEKQARVMKIMKRYSRRKKQDNIKETLKGESRSKI